MPDVRAACGRVQTDRRGEVVTETELNLARRAGAIQQAHELLTYLDHDTDDLIIVADWLLTGSCDTALRFAAQRAANYRELHNNGLVSLDEARWSPNSDKEPLDGEP